MSRDSSTRQRPRRRYSFSVHGQSEQGQRHGNYLIKDNQADLWSPAYGNGVTTIRIFPGRNPEDPQAWDPYRLSAHDVNFPLGIGDWIRRYPAVRSMGDPPVTFAQVDPSNPEIEDQQMTPGWLLFRAIDRAVAQGQDRPGWASLLRGSRGRSAQLTRPSEIYVVQGMIVQYKNRLYNPPKGIGQEDRTVVIELGPSAGIAMLNECHAEVEGYQGDPDDFESHYVNGDPISLDTGRFVSFYTLKDGDPRQAAQTAMGGQQGWNTSSQPGRSGQQRDEPIGYGCFMEPTFNGVPARMRDYESVIRQRVRNWEDIIRVPTIMEQARLLADKFPPEVIEYAWSAQPEWIPESVRRAARATVSVGSDGNAPQPGGLYQQQPSPYGQPAHEQAGGMPYQGSQMPGPQSGWGQPQDAPQWNPPPQAAQSWGNSNGENSHDAEATNPPSQGFQPPPAQQSPPQWGQQAGSQPAQTQPAQTQQPQQSPPQGGMMSWGNAPNPVASPPQATGPVPDPTMMPGSIPPSEEAVPATDMPAPAADNAAQPEISPPENIPEGQQFDPPPAQQPAAAAGNTSGLTPAQLALQRAQQARNGNQG